VKFTFTERILLEQVFISTPPQCSPDQLKKRALRPSFPPKRLSAPLVKKTKKLFLENDPPQVILSTSKCFKMTPYAIKMHLEAIKLQ
jgi:hypothetical protein